MRTFVITEEQITILDYVLNQYDKARLRNWFPEAFETGWEEVDLGETTTGYDCLNHPVIRANGQILADLRFLGNKNIKFENGKIWRRKP